MSGNQQTKGLGCIEAERIALIIGYPDTHFLVTRYPDNRYETNSTKDYVRIYKLFMQNKAKVKYAKINISSFVTSKYE